MTAHEVLRNGTRDEHARVDAAFSGFVLSRVGSYVSFLEAHARAVIPLETALANGLSDLPWRPRAALLRNDLCALGFELPAISPIQRPPNSGQLCGMIYVIEGSRLGSSVLAGRVGATLPTAYLSAIHQKGEWRSLLAAIDAGAAAEPAEWLDDAVVVRKSHSACLKMPPAGLLCPSRAPKSRPWERRRWP